MRHFLLIVPIVCALFAVAPVQAQQDAAECARVEFTSQTAFFKRHITNTCGQRITVRYCEIAQCGGVNYYNALEYIDPGQRKPVDTDGAGIDYAVCFTGDNFNAPRSDAEGNYHCP